MWRNYLVTSLRTLARDRSYAFINIFGLALGLAACIAILLFVRYETSYDAALPGAERAFQFQQWNLGEEDQGSPGTQMTSYASGAALKKDFPEIDRVVYVGKGQPVVLQDGKPSSVENFVYTDGPLFDVLQLPFVKGDRATALAQPGSIVLTETEAAKRFGNADPVGKTLTLIAGGKYVDYRITGVVADPVHSHLALSMVARYDPWAAFAGQTNFLTGWMAKNGWVYARLRPGVDVASIDARMAAWKKRNIPDQLSGGAKINPGEGHDWRLVNVRDIHLGRAQDGSMRPGNDTRSVTTFMVVAFLILAMAAVNFVNLSTARATTRAREVALRKVLGASRRQLVVQFLAESFVVVTIAMLIALALVELALPSFNTLLGTTMRLIYIGPGAMSPALLALLVMVGLASGLYPAFHLSRVRPATVLHANRSAADTPGSIRLRTVLVVGQFAVAIGLFICTSVIAAQTHFGRTSDPGYRREGLVQIANLNRKSLRPVADTLVNEIGKIDGVRSVGRSTIGVATWGMDNMTVTAPGASEGVEMNLYRVDTGFFPTMGMTPVAGRLFARDRSMDDSTIDPNAEDPDAAQAAMTHRGYNVVINEQAARLLGYRSPGDAVGKTLKGDGEDVDANGQVPATIVGVVHDARLRSVRDPLEPMLFLYDRVQPGWLEIRYDGPPARVRGAIESVWRRIAPEAPFDAEYSEDIVRKLYDAEEARAVAFAAFSSLAVVIGCLGLFGLAAFTTQRRAKEIGIRKVLGARVRDIVRLLAWQFSKPVVAANLVAWPVAWWVMRNWLNGFDSRIALGPEPFVLAGLLALAVAIVTVSGHAIRVARLNPIHALRYE